jgi:putative oxidoreductase
MKIVTLICRILLGLTFVVFGANGLRPFLPAPEMPPGLGKQFVTVLAQSHYTIVIFAAQLTGGILLLVNRYVPLALTILGPVLVNILCFHIFLLRTGLPLAVVAAILWVILFYYYRRAFAGIFTPRA